MNYHWDFGALAQYWPLLWRGALVTLAFTAGTIFCGLVLGLLIGLGRLSRSKLLNAPLIGLIEAFRCTPLLVQIVWFYYALPVLLHVQIPAVIAAGATLSLYTGVFYAADDAPGHSAAGDAPHGAAFRQSVHHPAQEHIAGFDHRRS
jgi:polar amino acid transport system permease protein